MKRKYLQPYFGTNLIGTWKSRFLKKNLQNHRQNMGVGDNMTCIKMNRLHTFR